MLGSDSGRVRAAIYCRISPIPDSDERLERQEGDCRTLCERLDWEVIQTFVDPKRSAWQRNRKRPAWDAMLQGVQDGRFDAIVVYHGDRLIRQPWDLEMLLSLASEKGLRLASPTGTRRLDNADDRFILRIEAAQACRESDNTSRRTKRAKEAKRAAGVVQIGGTRPFGRNADRSVFPAEAEEIEDIFTRILAGEGPTGLWREWVERGVPTVRGGRWQYTSFHQMLRRPDIAGLVGHRDQPVGPATNVEPIVPRETWEAVQGILDGLYAKHGGGKSRPRKHLLSAIAVCTGCEGPMVPASPSPRRTGQYRCNNPACPRRVVRSRTHLDEYVIAFVLERLDDERLWRRVEVRRRRADAGAGAELEALETQRAETIAVFSKSRSLKPAELDRILNDLGRQIEQVRARIAGGTAAHVLDGLRGLDRPGWDALPLDRQRAIIRELCTVRVGPSRRGPGFDVDSVDVRDAGEVGA